MTNENVIMKQLLLNCKLSLEPKVFVKGNSMNPVLYDGDMVFLQDDGSCKIGDIVLFKYQEEYIIHRIVNKKDNILFCKGDNSFRLECITKKEIIGKVEKIKRNGKVKKLSPIKQNIILMSYKIGEMAQSIPYDVLINSSLYKRYMKIYLLNKKIV